MKVYTYEAAPNPQRLALFMKYKGIELETVQVDMATGEQLSDEYRAINPDSTVPALVLDNGTVLSQVIGQCTYLEEIYPEKPLLGTNPQEKALVYSWCHKLGHTLTGGVAAIFRNRSKGFVDRALPGPLNLPQIPDMVDRGYAMVRHSLPELDAHLATNTWMAGDHFSLADIDLLTGLGFMGWVKEPIPDTCTHLLAWQERAQAEVA